MATPTLDSFLSEIAVILRNKDGEKLQQFLVIEPPLPPIYQTLTAELQRSYATAQHKDALEKKIAVALPEASTDDLGGSWPAFLLFMLQYFAFLRDVNPDHLLETHDLLKSLLNSCILALSDATMGIVVLATVVAYSRMLAKLAIGLERRPDLLARFASRQLVAGGTADGDGGPERVTLVEDSANVIREAFKKSLSERSHLSTGGLDPATGRPAGRRLGIYLCANLCLKLFFHCRKLRGAEQIFGNIYQQSPPLSRFAAAQRVTYLYYLGRYLLANNHFRRGALVLEAAYSQTPIRFEAQRRRILEPLAIAHMLLGRFPPTTLLARPEAQVLAPHVLALCRALRTGDLASFQALLHLPHPTATWLLQRRLLLQVRNRGEVLVWRSLARRVFVVAGFHPAEAIKRAPTFDLADFRYLLARLGATALSASLSSSSIDPDLEGISDDDESEPADTLPMNSQPSESTPDGAQTKLRPSANEVSAGLASLIQQGLLHGYLSHKHGKFVVLGARARPAAEVGFPPVWRTIVARASTEDNLAPSTTTLANISAGNDADGIAAYEPVPGWVLDEDRDAGGAVVSGGRKLNARSGFGAGRDAARGGSMAGMVVNLSGARPVGVS